MAVDFEDVKETVRTVILRLDSPSSNYNFVFSESDDAVEVCVEDFNSIDPLFVFVVDAERFRVLKALDLDPEGYASSPYHSYIELLSFIIEHFYPVFFKLTNNSLLTDMLSRLLGKRVRVWKDLLRVICEAGQIEFVDRGGVFKVLETNFWYNSDSHTLSVSGEINDTYKCPSVMELVITLLTVLAYIFQLHDLDANPLLGVQLAEEEEASLFDEEMDMGDDIDSMDMGGTFDEGGAAGEDLSAEFTPSGDSVESTAPEISEGKEDIMDEVMTASYRVPKGFRSIFSNANKGTASQVSKASPVSSSLSYTPLYSGSKNAIFSSGGFANADLIMNLKQNVLRGLGSSASWVFDDPVSSDGGLLNWSSTLSIKGKDHIVVFVQKGNHGDLVVVAGEKRIPVGRYGAFDAKFLRAFWGALGVRV